MTTFDNQLIAEANEISRFRYTYIDDLIELAETSEARKELQCRKTELYDLLIDTIF